MVVFTYGEASAGAFVDTAVTAAGYGSQAVDEAIST